MKRLPCVDPTGIEPAVPNDEVETLTMSGPIGIGVIYVL
jgi:hypothetical protein